MKKVGRSSMSCSEGEEHADIWLLAVEPLGDIIVRVNAPLQDLKVYLLITAKKNKTMNVDICS